MAEPEEPQGEERSEVEREREDPDEDIQPVKDDSDPWAKFSTGRDPDK